MVIWAVIVLISALFTKYILMILLLKHININKRAMRANGLKYLNNGRDKNIYSLDRYTQQLNYIYKKEEVLGLDSKEIIELLEEASNLQLVLKGRREMIVVNREILYTEIIKCKSIESAVNYLKGQNFSKGTLEDICDCYSLEVNDNKTKATIAKNTMITLIADNVITPMLRSKCKKEDIEKSLAIRDKFRDFADYELRVYCNQNDIPFSREGGYNETVNTIIAYSVGKKKGIVSKWFRGKENKCKK